MSFIKIIIRKIFFIYRFMVQKSTIIDFLCFDLMKSYLRLCHNCFDVVLNCSTFFPLSGRKTMNLILKWLNVVRSLNEYFLFLKFQFLFSLLSNRLIWYAEVVYLRHCFIVIEMKINYMLFKFKYFLLKKKKREREQIKIINIAEK